MLPSTLCTQALPLGPQLLVVGARPSLLVALGKVVGKGFAWLEVAMAH
jgi:hypothetical protein